MPEGVDGTLLHDAGRFGGHHQFVTRQTQTLDRVAGDGLGLANRVNVGGVDEVDAGVKGLLDQRGGGIL